MLGTETSKVCVSGDVREVLRPQDKPSGLRANVKCARVERGVVLN